MSDMKKLLESLDKLTECPPMDGGAMPPAPINPGNPVTMSVSLNASGMDHVTDLMKLLKQAGLEQAGPAAAPVMPMRQDMDRLRAIVGEPEMEADAAYSNVITDDENLDEGMDPKALMGQIRKMAKGVETSPDEREHRIFASQVESDLIDLFQYYNQVKRDTEKQEIVRNLIRQNKKAQQQTDLRNANNIVSVLWDLMNANETYVNEPEPEYQDHKYMTKDLSGGLNREKGAYPAAQDGDNAMAVEGSPALSPKFIKHLEIMFGDKPMLSRREAAKISDILGKLTINNIKMLAGANIQHVSKMAKEYIRSNTPGGMRNAESMAETIKNQLLKALAEKKSKPDFLDMDKDGNKKEPMKKAVADKKKKAKK